VEEVIVAAVVCSEQQSDGSSASRCTSDGNVLGITSELLNVLLHPLQSLDLISETVVGCTALYNLIGSQEAVRTDAVVEVDNDNVVVAGFD